MASVPWRHCEKALTPWQKIVSLIAFGANHYPLMQRAFRRGEIYQMSVSESSEASQARYRIDVSVNANGPPRFIRLPPTIDARALNQ